MFNLIRNERLKQYKKLSTWILTGVILLFMVLSTCLTKYMYSQIHGLWGETWQENYTYFIQAYRNDPNMEQEVKKYTYLLENDIPPSDWRTDVMEQYFSLTGQIQDLEAQLAEADETAAAVIRAELEAVRKQAEAVKAMADKKDWRVYIQSQIEDLNASLKSASGLAADEIQVELDVLNLYLEYNIPPVSREAAANSGYERFTNDSVTDSWKYTQLSSIREGRLNLLRGENEQGLLSSSQRRELELNVRIAAERLKTNAQPVESDSFLGLLDSTVSSVELISLILMVLAGGMIATEFGTGTIKLLLITPHKRREIFWSKVVILLEITLIAAAGLFVASFLLCGLLSGFSGIGDMQVLALFGQVVRLPYWLFILLKYLLSLLPVLVYGALALMLSAVTRKGAVAIAVSILLYVGGAMVTTILNVLSYQGIIVPGMKFLFFCNTDLMAYLPSVSSMMGMGMSVGTTIDPSMTLGFSAIVLLVYLICFLWIARDSFCRRDIK